MQGAPRTKASSSRPTECADRSPRAPPRAAGSPRCLRRSCSSLRCVRAVVARPLNRPDSPTWSAESVVLLRVVGMVVETTRQSASLHRGCVAGKVAIRRADRHGDGQVCPPDVPIPIRARVTADPRTGPRPIVRARARSRVSWRSLRWPVGAVRSRPRSFGVWRSARPGW